MLVRRRWKIFDRWSTNIVSVIFNCNARSWMGPASWVRTSSNLKCCIRAAFLTLDYPVLPQFRMDLNPLPEEGVIRTR
jgi:hypothetical protein